MDNKTQEIVKMFVSDFNSLFSVGAINSPSERAVKGSDPLLHDNSHFD